MKFKGNSDRRAYWTALHETRSSAEIEEALKRMPPETARVLQFIYYMNYSVKEIMKIMNRSRTTVDTHHARGMIRLYKYFNPDWWKSTSAAATDAE